MFLIGNFCKKIKLLITFSVFSLLAFSAFSQNSDDFFQHLEWENRGVVREYKVIVEEYKNSNWTEIISKTTKENSCDISLKPGLYRYTVCFYNVLGQLAFQTEYKNFEIYKATQPVAKKSLINFVYTQEDSFTGEISLKVENANSQSAFYLIGSDNSEIKAKSVKIDGENVTLTFPEEALKDGFYKILIKNNGGLSDTTGYIRIQQNKNLYLNASTGYLPSFILYDDLIPFYFGKHFLPLSFYADLSVLYDLNEYGKAGIGLIFREEPLKGVQSTDSLIGTLYGNLFNFDLNLVYNKEVYKYENFNIIAEGYFGGGLSTLGNLHYVYTDKSKSESLTSILPCLDAGFNAKLFWCENYYLKAGLDFSSSLSCNKADYCTGNLNILFGAGVQF